MFTQLAHTHAHAHHLVMMLFTGFILMLAVYEVPHVQLAQNQVDLVAKNNMQTCNS